MSDVISSGLSASESFPVNNAIEVLRSAIVDVSAFSGNCFQSPVDIGTMTLCESAIVAIDEPLKVNDSVASSLDENTALSDVFAAVDLEVSGGLIWLGTSDSVLLVLTSDQISDGALKVTVTASIDDRATSPDVVALMIVISESWVQAPVDLGASTLLESVTVAAPEAFQVKGSTAVDRNTA